MRLREGRLPEGERQRKSGTLRLRRVSVGDGMEKRDGADSLTRYAVSSSTGKLPCEVAVTQ